MTAEVNEAMLASTEQLALRVRCALSIGLDRLATMIDGLTGFDDAAKEKQRIRSYECQYRTLLRSPSSLVKWHRF